MNSPCIAVSHYKTPHPRASLPNTDRSSIGWAPWLSDPQWSARSSSSSQPSSLNAPPLQRDPHQETTTEQDIPNIMEQYRNLMFDFTFPEAIDFRDLPSGQLAATHRSTLVAEHGWKLWELVEMLKRISKVSNNGAETAKHIAKIEASMEEVRLWVEDQRVQQLVQEAGDPR